MKTKNIAIIGCGVIGTTLAKAIDIAEVENVQIDLIYDFNLDSANNLLKKLKHINPQIANNIQEIYSDKNIDLVVETASQDAVKQYSIKILESGKDLMIISIGALSNEKLFNNIKVLTDKTDKKLYIPSGAILGIDGIKTASKAGIDKVTLTTYKPAKTLCNTEYIRHKKIQLSNINKPKTVFEGSAREAVNTFPKSVNVASTLSIAGIGFDKTIVKIVADPEIDRNIHEINVKGAAGEFLTRACNFPSPNNPKTSYLAALSVIQALSDLTDTIKIGT